MRRVLILSPHFPPSDCVDMHRVRMTVGHYRAHGWEPTVLCVKPGDAGRLCDERLLETVPADVEVVSTGALPARPLAPFGISAIGFRAWPALRRAGARLLARSRFDLVFISTTAFPLMTLGRAWKRQFGVPFVLDFQDPWATLPPGAAAYHDTGLKHRLMRSIHRRLERWTLPTADGLMAVTQEYIDDLRGAYPVLRERPAVVSPFGFSAADFAVAERVGRPLPAVNDNQGLVTCLYAGAIAPAMEGSLLALFKAVAAARIQAPALVDRLRFVFVGTGYAASGNRPVASRLAAEAGIADLVAEHPDRAPLLDALKSMTQADVLLLLGSDTEGYIPSKLSQYLSLRKPVLCAAPPHSPLMRALTGLGQVLMVPTGAVEHDWPARLAELLAPASPALFEARQRLAAKQEARASAGRDCAFFDKVLAAGGPTRAA